MNKITRREFHRRVGEGMLTASLGASLAHELGLGISPAFAEQGPKQLTFDALEPLVGLMQDTPADKLQETMISRLKNGETDLRSLMQAAALANARTFGGEDYIGMHTLMAMNPAFTIASALPEDRAPLAVLKILHRNTSQIQNLGGRSDEKLHAVDPSELPSGKSSARLLNSAVHAVDMDGAERIFAAIAADSPDAAFNDLLETVEDEQEVHRVVFVHRAWEAVDLVGKEHAHTMLRQSLRYCVNMEKNVVRRNQMSPTREMLPKILDEYGLVELPLGARDADDAWMKEMSELIFSGTPEESARAAAAALKEGMAPADIGEAISLATNQLVLRDVGRLEEHVRPGKPVGSVHGDSIGVHACDSANAWRNMAKVSNRRNAAACLILGAYQATLDRTRRGGDFLEWTPRPHKAELDKIDARDGAALLTELDGAIREQDQERACAVVYRYGNQDHKVRPLLDLLVRYAVSEEGALHGEKFYYTTTQNFAETRPAFRWNHLVSLARVTASESGQTAPGYREACKLLDLTA